MPSDSRVRLAAQQRALVGTLVNSEAPPPRFDAARVAAAAAALFRKRMRGVAKTWPNLARSLGESFSLKFTAYAAERPLPRQGGPLADGWAFARHLAQVAALPDAGRLEFLVIQLRYRPSRDGLVHRRGPAIAFRLLRQPRRLVVGIRLPFIGQRLLRLRLGRLTGRDPAA
jgi:hypothetical protein